MDDGTHNTNDDAATADTGAASESSTAAQPAAPDHFDQHGVNSAWVKEMTTPPGVERQDYAPHETDRTPDAGRTTKTLYETYQAGKEKAAAGLPLDQQPAYDFNSALKTVLTDPSPEVYANFIETIPAEHR